MPSAAIQPRPSRAAVVAALQRASLPVEDLTDAHMGHFFYAGSASVPTGVVGIELCGTAALLRSLIVEPEARGSGLGRSLVEAAESHARANGAKSIFLLTTTAEAFFRSLGYSPADKASAPAEVRATREFSSICPASSAFLCKKL
jgi:amino-acid N-acetyltransferase